MDIQVDFPPKLQPLFEPARYKILYGGRGGAKSWGVARALLLLGTNRPLRVLCARELQKSMKDSVHKLLRDQIAKMHLEGYYDPLETIIRGPRFSADGKLDPNGPLQTEFNFEGIKQNTLKIKSYEGIDICWVEEAAQVTKSSWEVLIPTIRKSGSEIWITFNPELETDYTYQEFVVAPPKDATVINMNWRDNPWFEKEMMDELLRLKDRNFDDYLHVWEGHCKQILEGAVYAEELRSAAMGNRITQVPYEEQFAVDTFWDLGFHDATAIWFAQRVGFETRIIDFYSNSQKKLKHYLQVLNDRGYLYGTHWLPHDASAKQLGSDKTIEEQLRDAKGARRSVRIVPRLSLKDGINAARTSFPNCWFDREHTQEGVQALRHYRFEVDPDTKQFGKEPLHDWTSHAADAFRYLAIALRSPRVKGNPMLKGKDHPLVAEAPLFEGSINRDRAKNGLGWLGI